MDSERLRRTRGIFEAARGKSAESRSYFLREQCDGDPGLRAEVEVLLEADRLTDSFLDGNLQLKNHGNGFDDAPPALQPGTVLCNRYEIVRLLGRGGMGEVYEGRDKLALEAPEESLAIKLILPEYSRRTDLERRFKDEIYLARHVAHPNVVRIFNLETDGDLLFITMELVKGQDLDTLLQNQGKYTPREAAQILHQAVSGVEAVHKANILHRDLKTRNLMLQPDGRVVVMDFGLARPLDDKLRTRTVGVIGTLSYMPPQQIRGEAVDQTADLYSLGVVFHELLTGELPSLAGSPEEKEEALSRVLRESSPAPHGGKGERELSHIVRKCLEADPGKRYQSAKELKDSIEWWLHPPPPPPPRVTRWTIGAALLAAVVAALIAWRIMWRPAPPAPQEPITILIADFANLTGDPVFSGGTLESVLSIALETSPYIVSYSRGSARKEVRQLDHSEDLTEERAREIALRNGIQSVLLGSLDRTGSSYQLTVSLAEADAAPHVTRRATARNREDVLQILGGLATDIRRSLGEKSPHKPRPETFTSSSLAAMHAYAVAQELALEGKGNDAISEYRHAILLDPTLGRAFAGLAAIYRNRNQNTEALKYYDQALNHFDRMTDREKYRTRGGYYITSGSPDRAIDEFNQLVKEYPADNAGWANLALAWALRRDMEKAIEYGQKAIDIYPKNVAQRSNMAWYLLFAGRFPEAITQEKQALKGNRAYEKAYVVTALSQLAQGNTPEARKAYDDLRQISADGVSTATLGLADMALYDGRTEEAARLLDIGAKTDKAAANNFAEALKLTLLAQAKLLMGKPADALDAASRGDAIPSKSDGAAFQLAQIFVRLKPERAVAIADQMVQAVDPQKRSYGLILKGELSLQKKAPQAAIAQFEDALHLVDSWIVRYDLGQAYLEANRFLEADGEFEICMRRRGEATSVFIDDTPTYRFFPPVYYYHGLAEEGFKAGSAKSWYGKFLGVKTGGGPDQMIEDARRHFNKPDGADGK